MLTPFAKCETNIMPYFAPSIHQSSTSRNRMLSVHESHRPSSYRCYPTGSFYVFATHGITSVTHNRHSSPHKHRWFRFPRNCDGQQLLTKSGRARIAKRTKYFKSILNKSDDNRMSKSERKCSALAHNTGKSFIAPFASNAQARGSMQLSIVCL